MLTILLATLLQFKALSTTPTHTHTAAEFKAINPAAVTECSTDAECEDCDEECRQGQEELENWPKEIK